MMLGSKGLLPSTMMRSAPSATNVATCSCLVGPNPTFAGASSAKWAFDPYIIKSAFLKNDHKDWEEKNEGIELRFA